MDEQMPETALIESDKTTEDNSSSGELVAMLAKGDIFAAQERMLKMPQAECPVAHYFGPGIYVREVQAKAGTLAIGHHQRFEQLNILLKGTVAMFTEEGVQVISAPFIFTGKPGKKAGYIIEDMVWQTVYATQETDIQKLEEMLIDKNVTHSLPPESIAAINQFTEK